MCRAIQSSMPLQRLPRLGRWSRCSPPPSAGCNMVVLNPSGDIAAQQRQLIVIVDRC